MEKEYILETAEKLFFAKKYTDVKLDNVANELGIKKQTLYYYFKDKKDLFVQTLKFSINRYLTDLEKVIAANDIDNFIEWYLHYPSQTKNIFAISFQKGICTDKQIRTIIFLGKQTVITQIKTYFLKFGFDEVTSYLMLNLLEKLSQDNCIEGYCLNYDIEDLKKGIKNMFNKVAKI